MKLAGILTIAAVALLAASPAAAQQDTTHGKAVSSVAKSNSQGKAKGASKKKHANSAEKADSTKKKTAAAPKKG